MTARDDVLISDFIYAAGEGNIDAVRRYVESGGNVNALSRDYRTRSALFNGAYNNHHEVVKYLLEHGADPTIYPTEGVFRGDSVLYHAVHNRFGVDIIKTILERGADPNRLLEITRNTPITIVREPEILKLLLEHGGDPDDQPPHRMRKADDIAQNLERMSRRQRPLPDWFQETWNNNMKMFELLCEHGSTAESCNDYRTKKNILDQKTLELTGHSLPEEIKKNILRRGGKRGSTKKRSVQSRKLKSRRRALSSRRR